jgi:hypothetical protein
MGYPNYSYPPRFIVALARDILLLRKRDFHKDAQACIARLIPPLNIVGSENIPQHGPCVITVNHYHREGFGAQWFALAISAVVPINVHWIMTGEFTYPGKWYEVLGTIGSKVLLRRIAQIYDFSTMPPMPPREKDIAARATAVRSVLDYIKHAKDPILGLAPEGYDPPNPAGVLSRPPSGVGRFGLLLSQAGLKFIPVGIYEADRKFHIHFGTRYELTIPRNLSSDEKDRQASQIMMDHIARRLPLQLRGEFA